jgi:hypothetical protein
MQISTDECGAVQLGWQSEMPEADSDKLRSGFVTVGATKQATL